MASTAAHAQDIALTEKPGHTTEATVTIDAPPSQVYALVTDYAQWPRVLTDVESVTVKSGGREDARVRFRSRTLRYNVTIAFDNKPDELIRYKGIEGPPGGRASGYYQLTPIDGGRRTLVKGSLSMNIVGLPGAFISDSRIRSMRQGKLRADLTDVMRHFPSRSPS